MIGAQLSEQPTANRSLPQEIADDAAFDDVLGLTAPTEKWGKALDGGFQVLPDLVLRYQSDLKLTPTDLAVLLNLMMAWWSKERPPYPRPTAIARRMGVTERTVQRSLERLRKLRLLYKTKVKDRVAYDLSPLAKRLIDIASTDPLTLRRRELRTGEAGVHTQPLAQAQ